MPDTIRICHMIGSLRYGGAERQVVQLMNYLSYYSKCYLVYTKRDANGFYNLLNPQVRTYFAPISRPSWLSQLNGIARFLKNNRIDLLQTHMYWANLYGAIAGRLANVPVIITTEHGSNPWKKAWHYWIERNIITRFSDKRVCVSKEIVKRRRMHDRIPEAHLSYIPNCVDLPVGTNGARNGKFIIGAVGRFVEAKDFSGLMQAAAILRKRSVEFELYLLGDGPLRNALEAEREYLKLQAFVHMPGFQNSIGDWLRRLDLFVISSVREGQPLVLLEAMAHGLPVVATKVGGIPDTIADRSEGLLVEPGDPSALADAIQLMMQNEALRFTLGQNALQRIKRDFSVEKICSQYLSLYRALLEANIR